MRWVTYCRFIGSRPLLQRRICILNPSIYVFDATIVGLLAAVSSPVKLELWMHQRARSSADYTN